MLVGIATFQLFDVDFGATQFTLSGIGLSTAWLLGYGSIVGTILTNEKNRVAVALGRHSGDTGGQGLVHVRRRGDAHRSVAFIVFPDTVGSFFQSSDLWGLFVRRRCDRRAVRSGVDAMSSIWDGEDTLAGVI